MVSVQSGGPYQYIFGPVASRRLGRSLGIDLLPRKACTESCVFCEVGRTTCLTLERREYVPADAVIAEFRDWVARGGSADCVTLSGAGEPTLHSRFGDVLGAVRGACFFRTALLSNGTLLWMNEVRRAAAAAHIVKVSLSAWDQASFEAVNRPHPDLRFDRVLGGMRAFREEFAGELWMEVFILRGMNDRAESVRRIAELAVTVRPDRIQLNTVVRPPAERESLPVSADVLAELAALFTPEATVIASFQGSPGGQAGADEAAILGLLRRRGCTVEDVAGGFSLEREATRRVLDSLVSRGKARTELADGAVHYRAV